MNFTKRIFLLFTNPIHLQVNLQNVESRVFSYITNHLENINKFGQPFQATKLKWNTSAVNHNDIADPVFYSAGLYHFP